VVPNRAVLAHDVADAAQLVRHADHTIGNRRNLVNRPPACQNLPVLAWQKHLIIIWVRDN
jgi:hypothetical protein